MFLGAMANGITEFKPLYTYGGANVAMDETFRKAQTERRREEARVLSLMLRKESGLSAKTIELLGIWEQAFHEEVHGSKLRTMRQNLLGVLL
jgi:hypothetical protein